MVIYPDFDIGVRLGSGKAFPEQGPVITQRLLLRSPPGGGPVISSLGLI